MKNILSRDAAFFPAIILLAIAALAKCTWRKWPDPFVDCPREWYVAWSISNGAILGRDIKLPFGPFASSWNGWLFSFFGDSYTVLIWHNLMLIVLISLLLYFLFLKLAGRLGGAVASLVFITVFAFGQYQLLGGYNFMGPYSHDATYGLAAAVISLAATVAGLHYYSAAWLGFSGAALGIVILTKPDIAVAAGAGLAVLAMLYRNPINIRRLVTFAAAILLVPISLFTWYYAKTGCPKEAGQIIGHGWTSALGTDVALQPFYQWLRGTNQVYLSVLRMIRGFGFLAFNVLLVAGGARLITRGSPVTAGVLAFAVFSSALAFAWHRLPFSQIASGLPLISGVLACYYGYRAFKSKPDLRSAGLCGWHVFAFLIMGKFILNVTTTDYGFVLALPAWLGFIVFLVDQVPRAVARNACGQYAGHGVALALVSIFCAYHIAWSQQFYRMRVHPVYLAGDTVYAGLPAADPLAQAISEAGNWLALNTAATSAVLALPEGSSVLYAGRRRHAVPYTTYDPVVGSVYGMARMEQDAVDSNPDVVVWLTHDWRDYGVPCFGAVQQFGERLRRWTDANYQEAVALGIVGDCVTGRGITIYVRKNLQMVGN